MFVSGDIFELKLTEKQSKPGVLNWDNADESDVHTIRITVKASTITVNFMGNKGKDFAHNKMDPTSTVKMYTDNPSGIIDAADA